MGNSIIFLMDVSLTGTERGRSTVTRFKNLAIFLARNNTKIFWISCRGKRLIFEKKKSHFITDCIFHRRLRPIYPYILILYIIYLSRANHPNKIICHFPSLHEGLPALFINILSFGRISYYIDYMDLSPNILSSRYEIRFFEFFLERIITKQARKISVISPFLFHWARSLGTSPKAIHLIPLCISDLKDESTSNSSSFTEKLNQIEISQVIKDWIRKIKLNQSYLIGYQGTIHPHQGIEPLLQAFLDIRLSSFYLLLAGSVNTNTTYEKSIMNIISRINSNFDNDKIKLSGYLKSKDIQTIISLFDFGIIPKPQSILSKATFPSKSLRCLIEGIPIIATDSGWLKELTINTGGILIEGYDTESIIKALLSIKGKRKLNDDHWRFIKKKFNTARHILNWVHFLEL